MHSNFPFEISRCFYDGPSSIGMEEFIVIRPAFIREPVLLEEPHDLSSFDHPIPDPLKRQ